MTSRIASGLLVAFALSLAILHAIDPQPLAAPLSVFSVGRFHWLYQAAFATVAVALALLAFGTTGWRSIPLGLAGVGAAVAALLPSAGSPVTVTDQAHLAGSLILLAGTALALWGSRRSRSSKLLAWAASIVLAGTVALKLAHSLYAGPIQRLLVGLLVVGLWNMARTASAAPRAALPGAASRG